MGYSQRNCFRKNDFKMKVLKNAPHLATLMKKVVIGLMIRQHFQKCKLALVLVYFFRKITIHFRRKNIIYLKNAHHVAQIDK